MRYPIFLVFVVAACSSSSNNNKVDADTTKHDAKVWMDAPPSVPAMITIAGTAEEQGFSGGTPLPGATVSIFRRGETTPLGTATTDAQGKYSINVTTGGHVVDGYVKTTSSGHPDNYNFPAIPWQADDANANPQMITQGNFNVLSMSLLGSQAGQGTLVVNLVDASGHAVTGATLSTTPAAGKIAYSGTLGPDSSKTATTDDGIGYAGGVTAGTVTISGDKAGAVFKSHDIEVHGDAFTTAAITE